ncbi:MAG: ISL3 family transposase [Verrucomicrobia bacterium]|nr:ISL3 family transposase [Verrucomicrobiota bacterium]
MQLQLQTVLNKVHPLKCFVYADVRLVPGKGAAAAHIEARIVPRKNSLPRCCRCGLPGTTYDHQPERRFDFVPLWGLLVFLLYAPRRVDCPNCGVHVEAMPWARGKSSMTAVYMSFLATWARRLSWTETARVFRSSWDNVRRAVEWVVEYGLEHRDLSGISAIGVDEVQYRKGHKYLTLVYQIDAGCRRLLWMTETRTKKAFQGFFTWLGKDRSAALRVVCSDMWKPYLSVIRRYASQAINVLDKFHIVAHLNKAVDETRRKDATELRRKGDDVTLKHTRWCLLKRPGNLTNKQVGRLRSLLRLNLRTARAYILKEDFNHFWTYVSVTWAGKFLDRWCKMVMRSGIAPMKSKAKMLLSHRDLILNYFRAKKEYSSAVVEGLNTKVKLVTRKAFGYRKAETIKTALFHTLGRLPEPEHAHRFA